MLWDSRYVVPSLCSVLCGLLLWPAEQGSSASSSCVSHTPYLAPGEVVLDAVNREGDHLHVALAELGCQLRRPAKLCGADGREVPWVGEQDAPSEKRE